MTVKEATTLLIKNDYKQDLTMSEPDAIYFYKRIQGASNCQCNDRPPSIGITIYDLQHWDKAYTSMKINLRAETISGDWCDLGWYSMSLDRLEDLSTFEYLLAKAWESFN